ncbi:hypothetical protein VDR04_18790 [Xanthomonas campestris pv. campestris]|nr:hypothetical protein [Xanthomonas campestris pv. campestris]
MVTDLTENNKPDKGNEGSNTEDQAREPNVISDLPSTAIEGQTPQPTDEAGQVVKHSAPSDVAHARASEHYIKQFSAAEQMGKLVGASATEQMRKIINVSLGQQMRQIQEALSPLHSIQSTIGQLARTTVESPMQRFFDEQASRRRQMMEALSPKWHQTMIGSAFASGLAINQSFQGIYGTKLLEIQNAIHRHLKSFNTLVDALRSKLPSANQLYEFWLKYPTRVKVNLTALAEAGWYLDPEMELTDIIQFKERLENGTIQEVDADLTLYFISSLKRIEEALCIDHPARAHLIKEAFAAHREGKYSLSIPALFAQADGICHDLTGYQIFSGKGISHLARRIDPETLERAYLEPLLRNIPITNSSRQGRTKIPQLNRHAVMHGESTDFPSEQNGLKAISFVNFVSHVLNLAVSSLEEIGAPRDKH